MGTDHRIRFRTLMFLRSRIPSWKPGSRRRGLYSGVAILGCLGMEAGLGSHVGGSDI
jgi:hypothetical protein